MKSYSMENVENQKISEHPRKPYSFRDARNDLEVIEWLLRAGAITQEDAQYMKRYVQALQ